jgi:hypothetical protein
MPSPLSRRSPSPIQRGVRRFATDQRGVVVEWLLRLAVGLALLAVVVFDAGAVTINYITLDSTANDIAIDLSTEVSSADLAASDPRLEARARELAHDAGARLLDVSLDEEGVVRVRVARQAKTLVIARVPALRAWGRAVAGARSGTV